MPAIEINLLSIILAVVVSFIFGFVWYTMIFGRIWAVEMGFDPDETPAKAAMLRGMGLMILGNFFLAWVFAHNLAVWDAQTWGVGPSEFSTMGRATTGALFTWLGFFVPVQLSAVAWEKKSWRLFCINSSYHLLDRKSVV